MIRLACLLVALPVAAQPKAAPEAFTFDPQPLTLDAAAAAPQALAYAPDGKHLAVAGEGGEVALWDPAERKVTAKLTGHTGRVYAVAWSADGRHLATASLDKTAIIWDAETRKPRHTLTHPAGVFAVAIAPDGKTVATGGFDTHVRLWDTATGQLTATRKGHTASVRGLAFNPDGEELASAGADHSVRLWKLTGDTVRELWRHTRAVRGVAYLGPGFLASAGDDGRLIDWNLGEREPWHTFGPYPSPVTAVAAAPRGSFLVAGLGNGRVGVFDGLRGTPRLVLAGGGDAVAAVAVSPDGRQVAAAGSDGIVRIWPAGGTLMAPQGTFTGHTGEVQAVAVSPDGSVVATGGQDGFIRLYDAATATEKARWEANKRGVTDLSFSADSQRLASCGLYSPAVVWRLADRTAVATVGEAGEVRRVALSAKGTLVAWGGHGDQVRVHDLADGTVRNLDAGGRPEALQFLADDSLLTAAGRRAYLWDVRAGRVFDNLDGDQFAAIAGAAATADGKLIALTGDPTPGTQRPADVGTSRVLAVSRHHATAVRQRMNDTGAGVGRVAVSPDGRVIAAANGDGTVRTWEWPTPAPIRKLAAHAAAINDLALSHRGEFLVTAAADGSARRWNAGRGDPLLYAAKLRGGSKPERFARVSPDGKTLVTGGDDGILRVRDAVPGDATTLPGEYGTAFAAAVSPDGATLVTGHADGDLRVWDLKTGKELKKLDGHAQRVWSVAFTPDGTRLVSAGGSWENRFPGEMRIWDTTTWKTVHEFAAHDDLVFQVVVSPDGKRIASGGRDQTVRTWDPATGKPEHVLRMHAGAVRTVAFSRDGKRLYSGGLDGRLQWWDPVAGKALDGRSLGVSAVHRLRLAPDGKTLALALKPATGGGYAALWDIDKAEVVREFPTHDGQVNDVAFSPDGQTLVSVGGQYQANPRFEPGPAGPWMTTITVTKDGQATTRSAPASEVRCWDVATGKPLAALAGPRYWVETVQFTPDGSRLITVGGVAGKPGEVRVADFAGVPPRAEFAAGTGLTSGRFSPDGATFAAGGADGSLTLRDVTRLRAGDATGMRVLAAHGGPVRALAWSADGKLLVTGGDDGVVKVWDPKQDQPERAKHVLDRPVSGVAVAPDGSRIAAAAGPAKGKADGMLGVWKTSDGSEQFRMKNLDAPARGVAFTADGQLLACVAAEPALRVFDAKSGLPVRTLGASTVGRGLALSADGSRVGLAAQGTGVVQGWETKTWRQTFEVTAHPAAEVECLEFAPDGQTILTAGSDGAVVVWKMPGGTWAVPEFVPPAPRRTGPRGSRDLEELER